MTTCPRCAERNRPGRRFCWACGLDLGEAPCAGCGFGNLAFERFCGGCGVALGAAPAARPVESAERRQLTVMFCDMVGSTSLSGELEVEDFRGVVARFQDTCTRVVKEHDGFVARYMGDGLLAYFGYPTAQEDDAERAVRAGRAIVAAVDALTDLPTQPRVRVGIATGRVIAGDIVGEGASEEASVLGETPNLAARLQGLAAPGEVVVSDRTRRLADRVAEVEDMGTHPLKGFAAPVQAWRVVRILERLIRFDRSHVGPMIGREQEVALLLHLWRGASQGSGRAVSLTGGPGVGKSRLVHALLEQGNVPPSHIVGLHCHPRGEASILHPFAAYLSRATGITRADDAQTRLTRLVAFAARWGGEVHLPALRALLGLPDDGAGPDLDPTTRRHAMFDAILARLESLPDPLVLLAEDVQWADATSLELLGRIAGLARERRWLLVLTTRLDARVAGSLELGVPHLRPVDAARVVRSVAPGLDDALVERIVARADGVPAFLEEIARSVAAGRLDPDDPIPDTLQDSLMARLDRLHAGRAVARAAAVIGRQFPVQVLESIFAGPASTLRAGLAELEREGLIVAEADGAFAFRQGLLQEAAYASQLRSERQALHSEIADLLARSADTPPETLARHLAGAGRPLEASARWREAADLAIAAGATAEAIEALRCVVACARAGGPFTADSAVLFTRGAGQLGLQLRLIGRFEEGLAVLGEPLQVAAELDLGAEQSHLHYVRGILRHNLFEDASEDAALALHLARTAGSVEDELMALGLGVDVAQRTGSFGQVASLARTCIAKSVAHGYPHIGANNAVMVLAGQWYTLDIEGAWREAPEALRLVDAHGGPRARLMTHGVVAGLAAELGHSDLARSHLATAVADARRVGAMASALVAFSYGAVYSALGERHRLDAALREVIEALPPSSPYRTALRGELLPFVSRDEALAILDEVTPLHQGDLPISALVTSGSATCAGAIYRGDVVVLDRTSELVHERLAAAGVPFSDAWIEALEAVREVVSAPGSAAARARLDRVRGAAEARRVGSICRALDAIGIPPPRSD